MKIDEIDFKPDTTSLAKKAMISYILAGFSFIIGGGRLSKSDFCPSLLQ